MDILVKGALTFVHAVKRHRRWRRIGAFVRLRRRGQCTLLPGIFLSNVCLLCNKLDELHQLHLLFCASRRRGSVVLDTGLCTAAGRLPTLQSRSRHVALRQSKRCFFIIYKPFYSPCEFASFILVSVYIPLQANVWDAQCRYCMWSRHTRNQLLLSWVTLTKLI